MATFTTIPDYGAECEESPNVRVTKFGDGYEQRQANGINSMRKVWGLTFSQRSDVEKGVILTFLRDHNGVTSFDWVDPDGISGKYVCRKWKPTKTRFNLNSVTATFEQVFEP
jgi:phage-related protein